MTRIDKAHEDKERASGVRLVPHSTFSEFDEDLREAADQAEAARQEAAEVGGMTVFDTGPADYHAQRRNAKLAISLTESTGLDPDTIREAVLETAREGAKRTKARAASARKAAKAEQGSDERQARSEAPEGRRTPGGSTTSAAGSGSSSGSSGSSSAKK